MVSATDHAKYVIANQSGQVKGLSVEVIVWATRASVEKALDEANAYVAIAEAKIGVLFVENEAMERALSQEKINRAMLSSFYLKRE